MARVDEALAVAKPLAAATAKLGYAPLHAEALTVLGSLLHDIGRDDEAIEVLRNAAATADAAADDRARFLAYDILIQTLVFTRRLSQLDDALQQARAIFERTPYDAALQHRLLLLEGFALVAKRKPREAVAKYRELIAAQEKAPDPDDQALAMAWAGLADALARAGDDTEVVAATKRAEEILARAYGNDHAAQLEAQSQENQAKLFQGMMLLDQNKVTESVAILELATAKLAQLHGPDHEAVATGAHLLGGAYHQLGRSAEARTQLQRALEIHRQVYGDDNIKTAASIGELARLDFDEKHYEAAVEGFTAAHEVYAKVRGGDSLQAVATAVWTARALVGAGRLDDAAARIADIRVVGGEFGNAPISYVVEAEIAIERGRSAQAISLVDKAFERPPGRGDWIARAELIRSRALALAGRIRDARVHAERAVTEADKRGKPQDAAEARALIASLAAR
jgi:tetratricopeptide (TPR) repeat protein